MPSPFDVAMRAADAGLAASFGELIEIVPRVALPRHGTAMDVNRQSGTVIGVFSLTGGIESLAGSAGVGGGGRMEGITVLAASEALVWLPRDSIEALGWTPVKDDEVTLVERPENTYVVINTYPSDQKDIVLHIDKKVDV